MSEKPVRESTRPLGRLRAEVSLPVMSTKYSPTATGCITMQVKWAVTLTKPAISEIKDVLIIYWQQLSVNG